MSYPDFFGFNQSSLTFPNFIERMRISVDEFKQDGEYAFILARIARNLFVFGAETGV